MWRVCEASSIRQRQHPLAGVSELPAGAAHEPQEQISSKAVSNISSRAARRKEGRKVSGAAGNRRRASQFRGGRRGGEEAAAWRGRGGSGARQRCPQEGIRRVPAPAQKEHMQGVQWGEHLPAPALKEPMQGVRGIEHLRPPARKEHMQAHILSVNICANVSVRHEDRKRSRIHRRSIRRCCKVRTTSCHAEQEEVSGKVCAHLCVCVCSKVDEYIILYARVIKSLLTIFSVNKPDMKLDDRPNE